MRRSTDSSEILISSNQDLEQFNAMIKHLMLPQKEGTTTNERQNLLRRGMEDGAASSSTDPKEKEIFELGVYINQLKNKLQRKEIALYSACKQLIEKIDTVSRISRQKSFTQSSKTADCLDAFVKLYLEPIMNNKKYRILDAKHQIALKIPTSPSLQTLDKLLLKVMTLSEKLNDQNKNLFYKAIIDAYAQILENLEKINSDEKVLSKIQNSFIKCYRSFLYTLTDANTDALREARRTLIKIADAFYDNLLEFDELLSDIKFNDKYQPIFELGKALKDKDKKRDEKSEEFYLFGERITTCRNNLKSNKTTLYDALSLIKSSARILAFTATLHSVRSVLIYSGTASRANTIEDRLAPYLIDLREAAEKGNMNQILLSLQSGSYPLDHNKGDKGTALYSAAANNKLAVLEFLIDMGASVNVLDEDGSTPLHEAACRGHIEAVNLLIKAGSDITAKIKIGKLPIHLASLSGHQNIVSLLLEEASKKGIENYIESKDGINNTPLISATFANKIDLVRFLIKQGCNINATNIHGDTALHFSISFGYDEITRLLHQHGAKIDIPNKEGKTPLTDAKERKQKAIYNLFLKKHVDFLDTVRKGNLEDMMRSLEEGADIHFRDYEKGDTALHIAASLGHQDILNYLLRLKDSDLLTKNDQGDLPIHSAASHGQMDSVTLLFSKMPKNALEIKDKQGATVLIKAIFSKKLDTVQSLIQLGADINAIDDLGDTPLHYAAELGYQEIFDELMCYSPAISIKNKGNLTAADLAKKAGHTAIYDRLQGDKEKLFLAIEQNRIDEVRLNKNLDIHLTDKQRNTPLHIAAKYGRKEITQFLLEKGADIYACNESGMTPLHIAASAHLAVVKLLLIQSQKNITNQDDIDKQDSQIGTAIDIANKFEKNTIAEFLTVYKKHKGNTPLHLAAYHGDLNAVENLLKVDTDLLDMKNQQGETALHYAAKQGYEAIVSALLHAGCTDIENNVGKKASELAIDKGYHVISKLIKDANIKVSLASSGVNMYPDTTKRPLDARNNTEGLHVLGFDN